VCSTIGCALNGDWCFFGCWLTHLCPRVFFFFFFFIFFFFFLLNLFSRMAKLYCFWVFVFRKIKIIWYLKFWHIAKNDRRMLKKFNFQRLEPNLAKWSYGWAPRHLHHKIERQKIVVHYWGVQWWACLPDWDIGLLGHSEPAPTSTPSRMDDMWSGNSFLSGSSSLANHGG